MGRTRAISHTYRIPPPEFLRQDSPIVQSVKHSIWEPGKKSLFWNWRIPSDTCWENRMRRSRMPSPDPATYRGSWLIARKLNNSYNRSEEHTSELQSLRHLVCRLLLEKKKENTNERIAECLHDRVIIKGDLRFLNSTLYRRMDTQCPNV